jgi:hypothetical protein
VNGLVQRAGRRAKVARLAGQTALACVVLGAGLICYAYWFGVPIRLGQRLLARAGRGAFVVQAERLRLTGLGLTLRSVRCYRKGVVGAAGLVADTVTVRFSPLQWLAGYSGVNRIDVADGVIRPDRLCGPDRPRDRRAARPTRAWVTLRNCRIHDVQVVRADTRLAVATDAVELTRLVAQVAADPHAGQVSGALHIERRSGAVSGSLTAILDPRLLGPVMAAYDFAYLVELANRFTFDGDTPRCSVTFQHSGAGPQRTFSLAGEFRLRDCRYRGVELLRADGDVHVHADATNLTVALHDLFLRRPEGGLRGMLSVTPRSGILTFDATATIDPLALARMLDLGAADLRRHCVFDGAVKIQGGGIVDYETLHATDFRCAVQTARLAIGPLQFDDAACRIDMRGVTNTIGAIRASAYEGVLAGQLAINCPPPDATNAPIFYRAALTAQGLDFGVLMESVSKKPSLDYKGVLDGELALTGVAGTNAPWSNVNGSGRLRIKDGRVFLLPMFGGLSHVMTRLIPGLDFVLRQGDVRSEFTIADGRVHSDHIAIEGDVLSLSAHGDYTLPRDIDLEVQVRLLKERTLVAKLLRLLTYPVSKLFEFRVKGPVTDPVWYPMNFSSELLARLGLRGAPDADKADRE